MFSLNFSLFTLQIANPCKWSFCLLLCTSCLVAKALPSVLDRPRGLLPAAVASSSLCRDFSPFLCDFFLHSSILQPQPPAVPSVVRDFLFPHPSRPDSTGNS